MPRSDNDQGSYFDNVLTPEFELNMSGRSVSITFDAEKIYEYVLYRTDMFGTRKIYHLDTASLPLNEFFNKKITYQNPIDNQRETQNPDNNNDVFTQRIELIDYPFTLFGNASYTLVAYLKDNPEIKNASTKLAFVGAY